MMLFLATFNHKQAPPSPQYWGPDVTAITSLAARVKWCWTRPCQCPALALLKAESAHLTRRYHVKVLGILSALTEDVSYAANSNRHGAG